MTRWAWSNTEDHAFGRVHIIIVVKCSIMYSNSRIILIHGLRYIKCE